MLFLSSWSFCLDQPTETSSRSGPDFVDLGSHDGPMPQLVRMFLEGLSRQPGDATSTVATSVGRLVLNQIELMGLAIYLGGKR